MANNDVVCFRPLIQNVPSNGLSYSFQNSPKYQFHFSRKSKLSNGPIIILQYTNTRHYLFHFTIRLRFASQLISIFVNYSSALFTAVPRFLSPFDGFFVPALRKRKNPIRIRICIRNSLSLSISARKLTPI